MDKIRNQFWEAIKHYWPSTAEADQAEPGNLRVTYPLPIDGRPNRHAQFVSVHFDQAVLSEFEGADGDRRGQILKRTAEVVGLRMRQYRADDETPQAFIVEIDTRALDR